MALYIVTRYLELEQRCIKIRQSSANDIILQTLK